MQSVFSPFGTEYQKMAYIPLWRLAFLFFVVVLAAACTDSPDQVLQRSQQHLERSDYRSAVVELKALLQREPKNAQARWLLAEVYLQMEDGASAEKELLRAGSLGVSGDSVLPWLARALLLQGRVDDVLNLAVKDGVSQRSSGEIMATRGLAKLAKGDVKEAEQLIVDAATLAADSLYVRYANARLHFFQKDLNGAKGELDRILSADPGDGRAWSLLGDIQVFEKAYPDAEASYTKAIELRSASTRDQLRRGSVRLARNDLVGAAADADSLRVKAKNDAQVQYFSGQVYFLQRKYELAMESLENAYAHSTENLPTTFLLGAVHYQIGNTARALELAERAHAIAPSYIPGRKLLALLSLQVGDHAKVERLMSPVVKARPDDLGAKDILAVGLMRLGRFEQASRLLEELASKRRDQPEAQLKAGIGLLAAGQDEEGVAALLQATALAPERDRVNTVVVTALLEGNKVSDALQTAREFAEKNSKNPAAHNVLGMALLANGQPDDARNSFEIALALQPGHAAACQNLATLAAQRGDLEAAEKYLELGVKANPRNVDLIYHLGALRVTQGRIDEASMLFQQSIDIDPKLLAPRLALARIMLRRSDARQTLGLLKDIPNDNPEVLLVRADAYAELGQYIELKAVMETLRTLMPGSPKVLFGLAKVYAELGDRGGLERTLESVLQLAPNDPRASLMKARLLALDHRFGEATELLSGIAIAGDDPELVATKLLIARSGGNQIEALSLAQELFRIRPSSSSVVALASVQTGSGDLAAAELTIKRWLSAHPEDILAIKILSEVYERLGKPEDTILQLQKILALDSTNAAALNSLAWHLREIDTARSLGYAERAYELAPGSAAVLDTFADVLARSGEEDRALTMINRAIDRADDKPYFQLRRAELHFLMGKRDQALAEAKGIVARPASDEVQARAKGLIKAWGG